MSEVNYDRFDLLEEKVWYPNWYQEIAIRTLCTGVVPKHIAIIMDGNRRWATERGLAPIYGHIEGVKALDACYHWMETFGIYELTAFAFSPDNFKRDKTEVTQLMELFTTYFQRILDKQEHAIERGVRITLFGNIDFLPSKLRTLAAKVMLATRHNTSQRVNLAIGYKASDEMDTVLETLRKAVYDGDLLAGDIDEAVIDKCLYSGDGKCPDLLIRTSGEERYSDFYMWQLMRKPLFFCGGKWPEFSFTMLCRAVFTFQRYFKNTNEVQERYDQNLRKKEQLMSEEAKRAKDDRVKKFFAKRERLFVEYLTNIVNGV